MQIFVSCSCCSQHGTTDEVTSEEEEEEEMAEVLSFGGCDVFFMIPVMTKKTS